MNNRQIISIATQRDQYKTQIVQTTMTQCYSKAKPTASPGKLEVVHGSHDAKEELTEDDFQQQ